MTPPPIHLLHLPYVEKLQHRSTTDIDLAVIHCTELPSLAMAREYGEKIHYPESGTGNSGHYYIGQNGNIEQWVPPDRVAHHVRNSNQRSIGIELDNPGRYPNWYDSRHQRMTHQYPADQITGLLQLLSHLSAELPCLEWLCGHDALDRSEVQATDNPDLTVLRKRDPGPCFPWPEVLSGTCLKPLPEDN